MPQGANGPQVRGRDPRNVATRNGGRCGRLRRARHRDQLTGEQRTLDGTARPARALEKRTADHN